MEETKTILLKVTVDEKAAQAKMVEVEKQIRIVKKEEAELAKAIKEAGSATDEQIAKQLQLKGTLKELQVEQRAQQKVVDAHNKLNRAQEGSITQLRAELALLTDAWNDLSEEERDNTEAGQQLQKQTKAVSDRLKVLEQSVGDTRRQVGSYRESIKDAAGDMLLAVDSSGQLNGAISVLQKGYDKLKTFVEDSKASVLDEAKAKLASKGATDGLTTATNINKAAIIGNVAALKLLKFALAATGIGAVLLLLGGLISFLTRTQEGMDIVSQKTKGFTTVIGVLIDNLSAVGKRIWDFVSGFENLGDAAKKLGQLLLDNLISRLKGFLVIWEAVKSGDMTKLQDGIWQVGTGIADATAKTKAFASELNQARKSAEAIEKETQRIRDAERALNVEREKANVIIEQNKKIAEDTTKSEAVRIAAARKAGAELQRITDRQLQLQREKVANIEAEQALTNNLTEDNDKLAEEQAKLFQIEAANTGRSIELQNQLNNIRKEGAAKAKAATMAQLKAEADLLEIRAQSSLNSEEDELDLRIAILQKKTAIELQAENLTQLELLAIKEKAQQEEARLKDEFREDQRKKEIEAQERTAKLASETALKVMEAANTRQDMALKQQRAKGLITAQQYERQLETAKLMRMQRELMLLEQFAGKIAGQDEKIAAKRLEISNYLADKQIENQNKVEANAQLNAEIEAERLNRQAEETAAFVQGIGEVFAASLDQQGLDLQKFAQGVLLVTIDAIEKSVQAAAAEAILKATVSSMASPESVATAGAAGVIKAALLAGLIKGAFAVFKSQIIKATSSPVQAFAEGGYTGDGGKYEPAGIVHKGEYVIPQSIVKRNPTIVTELEKMRLKGYANGGYVGSNLPPSVRNYYGGNAQLFDYKQFAQAVSQVSIITKTSDLTSSLSRQAAKAKIVNQ